MLEVNYNTFQEQLEQIGKEVIEKKSLPEHKNVSEKELIKSAIAPLVRTKVLVDEIKEKNRPLGENFLPEYMKDDSQEAKNRVENLLNLAFKKGIKKAAVEAQKFGPYFEDAFHDAISDKIYDELKKRKII